jgi:hypothetical protein
MYFPRLGEDRCRVKAQTNDVNKITLSIPGIYDISVLMKEICHGITGRGAQRGGVVCCSNFFILKVSTNLLIGLTRMFEAWGSLAAF